MTCAVAPDGSVYPCAFLCTSTFLAGNVSLEPLSAIFHSSPVLERFRQLEVGSCRVCDRFSACHGGCPAIAHFLTGSPDQADPECLRAATSAHEVVPAEEPASAVEAGPTVEASRAHSAAAAVEATPAQEAMPVQEVA